VKPADKRANFRLAHRRLLWFTPSVRAEVPKHERMGCLLRYLRTGFDSSGQTAAERHDHANPRWAFRFCRPLRVTFGSTRAL